MCPTASTATPTTCRRSNSTEVCWTGLRGAAAHPVRPGYHPLTAGHCSLPPATRLAVTAGWYLPPPRQHRSTRNGTPRRSREGSHHGWGKSPLRHEHRIGCAASLVRLGPCTKGWGARRPPPVRHRGAVRRGAAGSGPARALPAELCTHRPEASLRPSTKELSPVCGSIPTWAQIGHSRHQTTTGTGPEPR